VTEPKPPLPTAVDEGRMIRDMIKRLTTLIAARDFEIADMMSAMSDAAEMLRAIESQNRYRRYMREYMAKRRAPLP
jgi:hypothetical protein